MYKSQIDLAENTRGAMINLLQMRLADALDLATQAKQAHWNVKGPHFMGLHELFDEVHAHARRRRSIWSRSASSRWAASPRAPRGPWPAAPA